MKVFRTLFGSMSVLLTVSLFSMQSMADQPLEAECRPILNEISQIENQLNSISNEIEAYEHRLDANLNKQEAVENQLQRLNPKTHPMQWKRASARLYDIKRDRRSLEFGQIVLFKESAVLAREIDILSKEYKLCMAQKPRPTK